MGTVELKDIVKQYVNIADDKILRIVKAVFESYQKEEKEVDFYDELPEAIKDLLEESIAQADRGEVTPHAEVMAEFRKKYNIAG
ncbi:MAG: putative transcriptional regulator [Dokdonia sp.]|jgi:predicted transcriptional regulator